MIDGRVRGIGANREWGSADSCSYTMGQRGLKDINVINRLSLEGAVA